MPGSESYFAVPGFKVGRSLRFNQPDDATLSKTFASAGNRRTWTFSCWAKIGNANAESGNQLGIFGTYTNNNDTANIQVDGTSGEFHFEDYSGSYNALQVTEAKLRDMGAWYHFVVVFDTTQGTAANRVKLYVNGTQMTTKTGGNNGYPDQNFEGKFNNTTEHKIGMVNGTYCWDGYLAEVNFIDGYSLPASYFGETDEMINQWIPIKYSGAYGNNGFYLNFKDSGIIAANGGTITTDGDYKVHSFTSNGTFTPTSVSGEGFVEYLVIAGGGAGAADGSTTNGNGGGGAGGYRTGMLAVTAQDYSITVGAGGVGALSANAVTGGNSVFSSITSDGGGGGGYYVNTPGEGGGSGGGGGANSGAGGGVTTAGFGNAGEAGSSGQGGGGGGAGEAGGTDGTGQGGDGLASSITGSSVTRAGGGGGSRASGGARAGGDGGGGAGGNGGAGGDGSANTGGGGGAGVSGGESGSGGSGIVIIRYKFQ